jgi:hypothetical protein
VFAPETGLRNLQCPQNDRAVVLRSPNIRAAQQRRPTDQYTSTSTAAEEFLTQSRKAAKAQGKNRLFFASWRLCALALNPVDIQ